MKFIDFIAVRHAAGLTGPDGALARRAGLVATSLASLALLSACGGGQPTEALPQTNAGVAEAGYNGPPPESDDVQAFKLYVWDNIETQDRCGACHGTGGQAPTFARDDDINLAFSDAGPLLDTTTPELSRLVSKVGGGHNCWLPSDQACADIMTAWVSSFAGDVIGEEPGGGRRIVLTPPPVKEVGASKSFPEDPGLFAATVHPLLVTYCGGCHSTASPLAQGPYIGNADAQSAYAAARERMNLSTPADSRFVIRLADEFHNCWGDCQANGAEMEAAIAAFSDQITPTEVDPTLLTSKALTLLDGTVASGGSRWENNVIGLWEFKTGAGNTAFDTSGVSPSLDLTISGDFTWVGGWGIDLRGGKAQGSTTASSKLHELITQTGEYSIEAWVVPGNVTQEEARIVSYSAGVFQRNFTLAQTLYSYDAYNRSSVTDANGEPLLTTSADDEDLQATLQHVVVTYDPFEGRRIYVNGVFTDDLDDAGGGSLADWDETYAFVLGNEVSNDRPWSGVLRLVAIHNRALTPEQITQNYEAGVGEKFYLLFDVSELAQVTDAYILFEVSRFDNYAYLFNEPRFISLDPTAVPQNIPVQGMRIGVNGSELTVGQAYANLDVTLDESTYDAVEGQFLSRIGTIVGLDQGPETDEFFLTFDRIGSYEYVRTGTAPLTPPPADGDPVADIGIRTFAEINATMSTVTGVDTQNEAVRATYQLIRQQLPAVDAFGGFLSSHQIAVAQLAIEYCNTLVDDPSTRGAFFPGFDFGAAPATAFGTPDRRDLVIDPLVDRIMGTGLASQPDPADVRGELNALIDRLTACGGACPADKTGTIVKATCSALLGSAVMLVQ